MAKKRRTELDIDPGLSLEPEPASAPEPAVAAPPPEPAPPVEEDKPRLKIDRKKLSIIIGAALAFVLASVIAGWSVYRYYAENDMAPQKAEEKKIIPDGANLYSFKPFIIYIGKGESSSIINITFVADVSAPAVKKELDGGLVLIRENIFQVLQEKPINAFSDETNRRKIAAEVATVLNRSLQEGSIKKILITEMLIR